MERRAVSLPRAVERKRRFAPAPRTRSTRHPARHLRAEPNEQLRLQRKQLLSASEPAGSKCRRIA
mgnify:CR=1 FL=1